VTVAFTGSERSDRRLGWQAYPDGI